MIITFKSKAAGKLIMFGDVAKYLLEQMGKMPEEEGIITEEQLADAVEGLRRVIAADKEARKAAVAKEWKEKDKAADADGQEEPRPPVEQGVSMGQRAVPLLDLLERSRKRNVPVIWAKA